MIQYSKVLRALGDALSVTFAQSVSLRVPSCGSVLRTDHSSNGKVERANRTLIEGMRAVLHGVDQDLWPWAASYVAYCYNRRPRKHRKTGKLLKTPYELATGRTTTTNHLRKFGCLVMAHVYPHE
jgi:hypothetical protein